MHNFDGLSFGKRVLGRPTERRKDKIRIDIREILVKYMKIASNPVQLWALLLRALNARVCYQAVRYVLLDTWLLT